MRAIFHRIPQVSVAPARKGRRRAAAAKHLNVHSGAGSTTVRVSIGEEEKTRGAAITIDRGEFIAAIRKTLADVGGE